MREAGFPHQLSILDALRLQIGSDEEFSAWIAHLTFTPINEQEVAVALPNVYWGDFYERKYRSVIESAVSGVVGRPQQIRFVVSDSAPAAAPAPVAARPSAPPVASGPAAVPREERRARLPELPRPTLNPRYVFDNFIVGPSNRLAHAASLATAENPVRAYNPLFLHGSVGLGKTHLLQAICHTLLRQNPDTRIAFLSCEEFVNNYISAVKRSALETFRHGVRTLDVLVIDDIHFLANREGSQEEFFHTFNTLHNAQKQIILSSDAPPKSIPTLEDRLVSRFKWGMVAQIDAPTFEMRVAILRRKAELHGLSITDDVFHFIATHIDSNIRELEGAILKLAAHCGLQQQSPSLATARLALRDTLEVPRSAVTVADIQNAVTKYFSLKLADLQSKRRSKAIALPRQIAIYLARTLTGHSLEEIGAFFGGKDHTTILYAVRRIGEKMVADEQFRAMIELLSGDARQRCAQ